MMRYRCRVCEFTVNIGKNRWMEYRIVQDSNRVEGCVEGGGGGVLTLKSINNCKF